MENSGQEVKLTFSNEIKDFDKLKEYEKALTNIKSVISKFPKNINFGDSKVQTQIKNINKSLTDTEQTLTKIGKTTQVAFNYTTIREFGRILKRTLTTMAGYVNKSQSYLEDINLFQVAFDDNYNSAERFINKLTEMYGLDEKWLTRTVAIFKQLSNAMNLSVEQGTKLSKLMTQMSVDISSLYNLDIDRASSVLQSALAGQTKPIRGATGADITQATLQQTLNELGMFDKSVTNLSYAEKRLLIIVSLTRQVQESTGDWGRTLESPANQTRILSEQWERLTRAVGNVFLPFISKALPYLNAILMVLTEILSTVATLLGFNVGDYDYFGGVADSVLDLEDGLESANASAEKLKRGLRSFDKLNNITTPSSGGGTAGAGGMGSIDPKIWNAFNDAYDNYFKKLDDVQMKATKIRDRIMEILGFQKEVNAVTGDVSFKYLGFQATLKGIWNWFKKLTPEGKILSIIIGSLVTKGTIKLITSFVKLLGRAGLFGWVTKLVSPFKNLGDYIKVYTSLTGNMVDGVWGAIDSWSKHLTITQRLTTALIGAGGLYASLKLIDSAMKDVAEQGNLTAGSFLKLSGGIAGATASGALLGSQFGAIGTIIGATGGLLFGLYETYMKMPTEISKTNDELIKASELTQEYNNSLKEQYDYIKENSTSNMSLQSSYQSLVDELKNYVDEDGRVKQGYEDRVQFIITSLNKAYGLEIEMVDGVIQKYQEQIKSIQDIIFEKRKQIALESAEESYSVAMKEKAKTYANLQQAQENYNKALENQEKAQEKYNEKLKDWAVLTQNGTTINAIASLELKKARDELNKSTEAVNLNKDALDGATKSYDLNTEAIMTYEGLLSADTKENAELVEKYIRDIENSYNNGKEYIKLTYEQQLDDAITYYASVLRETKKNEGEITNEVMTNAESRLTSLNSSLSGMTNSLKGNLGENVITAWGELAKSSENIFIQEFGKLDDDVQQEVVDKMSDKGYNLSKELQNGINKAPTPKVEIDAKLKQEKQTLKVDADTSQASNKTQSWWDRFKTNMQQVMGTILPIPSLRFAEGGLPPVGQIFVANERGAELVGNIGGQSFVANQNQVVDLLDRKLADVNAGIQNATFIVQVGTTEIGKVVLNDLQNMAKSNGKPITINM